MNTISTLSSNPVDDDSDERKKLKIYERAKILESNGFGYQAPGSGVDKVFVIAVWPDSYFLDPCDIDSKIEFNQYSSFLPDIRRISQCKNVNMDTFVGYRYLTIHWNDYSKIYKVLNACISLEMNFNLMIPRLKPFVNGKKSKDH